MHIPDGMLSAGTTAASGVASLGFLTYSTLWIRRHLDHGRVVLMAVMAALIFALQMLNFPVAAGTSGHFAGGAAAAILLGPWPAAVVMTTVLLVQALLFADGGIFALGANILNLAILAPITGYAVWTLMRFVRRGTGGHAAAAFVSAWVAVVIAALAAGVEIWMSGNARLGLILGAMGFWHALIGLGEGAITAGLITYVFSARPDLLGQDTTTARSNVRSVALTLAILAVLAVGVSFAASPSPDGLEFAYFGEGIGAPLAERLPALPSIAAGYLLPGISNDALAGILAGIVGLVVAGALLWAFVSKLTGRKDPSR